MLVTSVHVVRYEVHPCRSQSNVVDVCLHGHLPWTGHGLDVPYEIRLAALS